MTKRSRVQIPVEVTSHLDQSVETIQLADPVACAVIKQSINNKNWEDEKHNLNFISNWNRNYKIRKTLSEKSFFTLSGIKASPHKSHLMFRGVRRLVGILRMNSFETTKKKYFQFDNDYFLEFSSFSV